MFPCVRSSHARLYTSALVRHDGRCKEELIGIRSPTLSTRLLNQQVMCSVLSRRCDNRSLPCSTRMTPAANFCFRQENLLYLRPYTCKSPTGLTHNFPSNSIHNCITITTVLGKVVSVSRLYKCSLALSMSTCDNFRKQLTTLLL